MPETIHVNGTSNSLVHKGSNGIASSTVPDVCKTPSPAGPVPIPYPVIVSMSSDLENGSTTVTADGGNMIAIKDCDFSRCTGDEAGTAGGVASSTFGKEAKFILYSFDVKIDGGNACRLADKMTMNHQNTMCLAGVVVTPVVVATPTANYTNKRADMDNIKSMDKRRTSTVGDGTTAAALRNEIATGAQTGGRWHYKKAKDLCNAYKKREDDALKEERNGDITKAEADDLRSDAIEGFVRNDDAVAAADLVASPPWPT